MSIDFPPEVRRDFRDMIIASILLAAVIVGGVTFWIWLLTRLLS